MNQEGSWAIVFTYQIYVISLVYFYFLSRRNGMSFFFFSLSVILETVLTIILLSAFTYNLSFSFSIIIDMRMGSFDNLFQWLFSFQATSFYVAYTFLILELASWRVVACEELLKIFRQLTFCRNWYFLQKKAVLVACPLSSNQHLLFSNSCIHKFPSVAGVMCRSPSHLVQLPDIYKGKMRKVNKNILHSNIEQQFSSIWLKIIWTFHWLTIWWSFFLNIFHSTTRSKHLLASLFVYFSGHL